MLVDVNVSFGAWPFQRFDIQTLQDLDRRLEGEGVERAFVSHLGAVFHPDAEPFNNALLDGVRSLQRLRPVPVVNPAWPRWRVQLDACRSMADIAAVKIYPSFHNYRLIDAVMDPLMAYLSAHDLRLLVQMRVEDERMQYFALNVQAVSVEDIVHLHRRYPDKPFICLNAYLPEARRIGRDTRSVGVDTAFCEWLFTMERLLEEVPAHRIFFGSHTPFLYTKASTLKLTRSTISDTLKRRIGRENALEIG